VFDLTQFSSTELEASVSGYTGAIFRSCPSIAEAQIRFRLFTAKVAKWFAGPDPFHGVGNLLTVIEIEDSDEDDYDNDDNSDGDEEMGPAPQPATPELATPELPLTPQVSGPSDVASIDVPASSDVIEAPGGIVPASSASLTAGSLKPGDGWYVVYAAVFPGVFYGV